MSKLAFVLCLIVYVAAEGGAIFEMKGQEPKIVFGELANPVCELKLDRTNTRLESTCDIFSAENEVLKAEVAELKTNNTELKAEIAEMKTWKTDMEAQMEHVMKTIAVITPPPSLPPLPPSFPPSFPPASPPPASPPPASPALVCSYDTSSHSSSSGTHCHTNRITVRPCNQINVGLYYNYNSANQDVAQTGGAVASCTPSASLPTCDQTDGWCTHGTKTYNLRTTCVCQ